MTIHVGEGLVKKVGGCCFIRPYGTKLEIKKKEPLSVWFIYTNCEIVDTQYRLLAKLAEYMGQSVPLTGWPTDKVYESFVRATDKEERLVIVVLDEIDRLLKKGSSTVLYDLTRINSDLKRAKVSIIGISNDLDFIEFLDPRVRSFLGEEELVFPPYHAEQLVDILSHRAEDAFFENALDPGVIPLCAAFAAQDYGDARRALNLLRISGEIAEREGTSSITEDHVRIAKNRLEQEKVIDLIRAFPTQTKFVLFGIMLLEKYNSSAITTGEVYYVYKKLCKQSKIKALTLRRVSDIISELDVMEIVNATVVSKGRHGRTKEVHLGVSIHLVESALEKHQMLKRVCKLIPPDQLRIMPIGHLDSSFEYDVFICHASEDKESFVRQLAKELESKGLRVWYDESTLLLGDSLRSSIDHGLARSRYGIVVLSNNFFEKGWSQNELAGLVAREVDGEKVILPVWHGVGKKEVQSFSPILADRLAVSSEKGIDNVVNEILRVLKKKK
ncbi:MAG: TIR domain-containing protein [Theionarchaea archaeon]|nr:TIR domain-containing protein [Theionarchaea archaeon]